MKIKLLALACLGLFSVQSASAIGERQRNTNVPAPVVNGTPGTCTNAIVKDCSFEDIGNGLPSPWIDFSTNFGTGICDAGGCGTGTGTAGPFAGAYWAWLGGSTAPEITSEGQQIIIPSNPGGSTTLTFQLWAGQCTGGVGDFMRVVVDGTEIFRIDANDPSCGAATYSARSANLTPFADGGTHLLEFIASTGNSGGGGGTNFNLDDINVIALGAPPIPAVIVPVPTLGQWSLFGLAGLAGLLGLAGLRRRRSDI